MQKFVAVCGLFVVMFVAGFCYFNFYSTPYRINRDPAAIGKVFDFSHLKGEKLQEAVKQRLLAGFTLKKGPEGAGIGLGHFVFLDQAGERKLACQEFSKITLTFEGDGASVAGDRPVMDVEGACEYSADMSRINPLWIPVAQILGEKAGDGDFQFNEGNPVAIRFMNIPDEWPRTWILKSVKLMNENNSQAVIVEGSDVVEYLGHPLVLSF
ncbi:hypothetical protein D3C87_88680 [compost metagenome]